MVGTIVPFLAKPSRHVLSAVPTQLNWTTHAKLLKMSEYLLDQLRRYGARDFIDVRSFICLIAAAWND